MLGLGLDLDLVPCDPINPTESYDNGIRQNNYVDEFIICRLTTRTVRAVSMTSEDTTVYDGFQ